MLNINLDSLKDMDVSYFEEGDKTNRITSWSRDRGCMGTEIIKTTERRIQ